MSGAPSTKKTLQSFGKDTCEEEKTDTILCQQCVSFHSKKNGFSDETDGLWYCFECWFQFNTALQNNKNAHVHTSDTTVTAAVPCTNSEPSTNNTASATEPICITTTHATQPANDKVELPNSRALYNQIPIKLASDLSSLTCIVTELLSHKSRFLGVDIEWKPQFVKGGLRNKVPLIQIGSEKLIILIQMQRLEHVYQSFHACGLLQLLEDRNVLKCGVGIFEDQQKLYADYGIRMMKCVDLNNLNLWPITQFGQMKLKEICKTVLGWNMQHKSKKCTMSNWERKELTEKQILYAAEDAFVSYRVFDEMLRKNSTSPMELLKKICAGDMDRGIGSQYGLEIMESFRKGMIKIGSTHSQFALSAFRTVYGETCGVFQYKGKLSKIIMHFRDIFSYDKASGMVISKIYKRSDNCS